MGFDPVTILRQTILLLPLTEQACAPETNMSIREALRVAVGSIVMVDVDTELTPNPRDANRVCVEPGCATLLSRYNDGAHCALHAPMQVPRMRGRKSE